MNKGDSDRRLGQRWSRSCRILQVTVRTFTFLLQELRKHLKGFIGAVAGPDFKSMVLAVWAEYKTASRQRPHLGGYCLTQMMVASIRLVAVEANTACSCCG